MLSRTLAPALRGARRASVVVDDAQGNVIYEYHPTTGVAPASVQKLVVSFASLHLLGPAYRFDTILAASHPIASDGTLSGPLWLVGSGDPSFRSTDLRAGVRALKQQGLRSISGGIAVDPSAMSGPEINPYWSAADANEDYQTAISADSLDGDTVEFRVFGTSPGEPARVTIVPASRAIRAYGSVETGGGDDVIIAALGTPNQFRLSGAIPPNVEEKFWLPVHSIARYDAQVLARMLHEAGIRVRRDFSTEPAPLDTIALWQHRSKPLPVLMRHMLYISDNHYAEQLLRTLGGTDGAADDANGIAVEKRFLRSRNISTTGMHVVDGSGLAEINRVTARTLTEILSQDARGRADTQLYPLLPAGGRDGTLKYYGFTSALGRIRAKTGHLSDADSLAGYLDTKHHGRLAFAFMIDDSPGDPDIAYVRALDRLVEF